MTRGLPVVFTSRATREIEAANAWWRENRRDAPNAIREELAIAIELISVQPGAGSVAASKRLAGVRRVLLPRINYLLYYRLRARLRRVDVVAFWHARRGGEPKL